MDRLQSMRVFQKVIDEGGFAAAARALGLSAAVVTRLVADLEAHLGARLLHRTTRRISLSTAGEEYLERVRAILQDLDEADAAVSSRTDELAGELRLLAPPVLATHLLAPMIADFRRLHPRILLNITVESFREPPIEDFDLTLLPTSEAYDGAVVARKISSTEAVLVAAPSYLARKGVPATPLELAQHEVLRLSISGQRQSSWRLMDASNRDAPIDVAVTSALWVNHTDTLLRATLDGAGITSAPIDLIAADISNGALVRVLRPWITGRLALFAALPSRKFIPGRTKVFLDYLVERTRLEVDSAVLACENC